MRRRLICLALVLVLIGSCLFAAFAFEDSEQHWASESIERAVSLGLFNGVSETEFAPDAPMTRAMFVTVLGRLAGIDPDEWSCDYLALLFSDVTPDAYYAPYLAWAAHTGIANGTGGGRFSPAGLVTREQMAHFISNYLSVTGATVSLPELPALNDEAEPVEDAALPEDDIVPEPTDAPEAEPEVTEPEPDALILPAIETAPEVEEAPEDEPVRIGSDGLPFLGSAELRAANGQPQIRQLPGRGDAADEDPCACFSDAEQISGWARDSVGLLTSKHLLNGMPDEDGGVRFAPQDNATRAECATLFCRLADRLIPAEAEETMPVSVTLNEYCLLLEAGESTALAATVFPTDASNRHLVWYSTDPDVAAVDANGVVTARKEGFAFVFAVTSNRLFTQCEVQVTQPPPDPISTEVAPGLAHAGMTSDEKDMMIFGRLVDDPRYVYYYEPHSVAEADMTTIQVLTWDLRSDGTKYTRSWNLTVHKNIAPTMQAIFAEIYALPEQPPIHSLGGYRWDGRCEHTTGTAVDINPAENYYCNPDGSAIVGKYFKPGEDPYSIPVGGSVDQIFAKYGFTRGIYWSSGKKDYMHYSFWGM